MKRIVIVCFIMVGIIATGVGSLVHLIRVSDEMDQMLSEVAQAIDRDDLEHAASIADQFSSAWEKNEAVMTRYIHHDELDMINGVVARLPALAQYGAKAEYAAEVDRLRKLISHIRDSEIPNLSNIF